MRQFCLLVCLCIPSISSAQSAPTPTIRLPRPHVWGTSDKQYCVSAGGVGIQESKESPYQTGGLLLEPAHDKSRLEISLNKDALRVSVDGGNPVQYKIEANTNTLLTGVQGGSIESAISTILIDKVTSYVIWSRTEPPDWNHDVPRHSAAFYYCSGASLNKDKLLP